MENDHKWSCGSLLCFLKRRLGFFYGIMCGLCRAGIKIIEKDLTYTLNPGQIMISRSTFQFCFAGIAALIFRQSIKSSKGELPFLVIRCFFHSMSLLLCYISLSYVTYYECIVGMFGTLSIASVFVSKCCLSENVSCYKGISTLVITLGIFMTFEPNLGIRTNQVSWKIILGYVISISAGIVESVGLGSNRKLINISPFAVALYCAISSFVLGIIVCLVKSKDVVFPTNPETIGKCFLLGLMSATVIGLLSRGIQVSSLVEVCLAMQIDIPTGLVLQVILFHQLPKLLSLFGGLITVLGIISLILEGWAMEKIHSCGCLPNNVENGGSCEQKGTSNTNRTPSVGSDPDFS